MTARAFLRDNMHVISETYLDHDAGVDERNGIYLCPCGMRGTEAEWERHVADKIADVIDGVPAQGSLLGAVL